MPNFRNSFIFMLRHDSRENEIHWVFWCKQKFAHLRHQGQDAADLASRPTFWSRKWQPWHGGLFHTTSVLAAESLLDPSNLSQPGSAQAVEPNLEPDSANRLPHYDWGPRRRDCVWLFLGMRPLPGLVGPSGEELKEPLKNTQKWRDISPSMALKLKGAPGGSWNALYVLVQLGLIRFSGSSQIWDHVTWGHHASSFSSSAASGMSFNFSGPVKCGEKQLLLFPLGCCEKWVDDL